MLTGATDKPDPSRIYKLAFDVQSMADSADKVSPALMPPVLQFEISLVAEV
jgi:hypothetical protein